MFLFMTLDGMMMLAVALGRFDGGITIAWIGD